MIKTTCPGCQRNIQAPKSMACERIQCPACKNWMVLPGIPASILTSPKPAPSQSSALVAPAPPVQISGSQTAIGKILANAWAIGGGLAALLLLVVLARSFLLSEPENRPSVYQDTAAATSRVEGSTPPAGRPKPDLESLQKEYLSLSEQGDYVKAEVVAKKALQIAESVGKPNDPDVAMSLKMLAMLYINQNRFAQAEPLLKRALAIEEETLGPEHPDVVEDLKLLAAVYASLGQEALSRTLMERVYAVQANTKREDLDVAEDLKLHAISLYCRGQLEQAEHYQKRSLEIIEKLRGPDDIKLAGGLFSLASIYKKMGRASEAAALDARARAIVKALSTETKR